MKKLFITLSILALLGCSKSEQSDADGIIEKKATAKSIFTNLDNLEKGINAAQNGHQDNLTPAQLKISEMLKPCAITYENPDDNSSNTLFSGNACPIHYLRESNTTDSGSTVKTDFVSKADDFINLVKFHDLKTNGTSKITSSDTEEHLTQDDITSFRSDTWGVGTHSSHFMFDGKYLGDKNHMGFFFGLNTSIKSDKVDLTISARITGKMISDDNGNTEIEISTHQCSFNGASMNCQELDGILGGDSPTQKVRSIKPLIEYFKESN